VTIDEVGAIFFGVVIGWITYRTLRRTSEAVKLSDLATVIGAVGGAAVAALFEQGHTFAWYSIGLAVGFFGYLILGHTVLKNSPWLGGGS
jgi:ABC-type Co2+ transport system permease subunit